MEGKLDWERFQATARKKHPLDERRFFHWRNFIDYNGGHLTDQGTHLMDVIQWFCNGGKPPISAVCQGAVMLNKGGDAPDTFGAVYEYPSFSRSTASRAVLYKITGIFIQSRRPESWYHGKEKEWCVMKIGIIGAGNMGRALGLRWARGGHEVVFGSRDLNKAKAIAAGGSDSTQAGDFDAAAAFGEVILYTIRDHFPSSALKQPQALSGKIVIDCNNSAILGLDIPHPDNRPGIHFTPPIPSLAERLAADAPGARVVKAFNTMASQVIELGHDELSRRRVSVFLCSDDAQAKSVVKGLAEELGFIGVDCGELERARLVESVGDFIRFQIISLGLGPFTTISVNVAPAP